MRRAVRSLHVYLAGAVIGGLASLFVAAPAFAQTAGVAHEVGGVAGYGAWDWIGLTFRMVAVLLVIWGSVVAMRWYVRRMNGEAGGGITRALQIVETRPLGPNRALHLVRIGDRAVLIGATPERINALMEIDDPAQLERLFAGGGEPARRGVPGLLAGLTMLPAFMSRARETMTARTATRAAEQAARAPSAPPPSPRRAPSPGASRPAGVLTDALARLGRRMRGAPKAATAAALPPRPEGSLFDRTLADAQRTQGGTRGEGPLFDGVPDFAAPVFPLSDAGPGGPGMSVAGLRARAGYLQAAAADDALAREARISELQRAIVAARRIAG